VRQAAQHHRLSITTVVRAYLLLESRGILESRPQSGYFVRAGPASHRSTCSRPDPRLALRRWM
jgi:DNA-binding transcriptional regulator YhcF (GntR family)